MNAARALLVFLLGAGLSLGLGSCSSGSTTAALEAEPLTVGDIYQLILNSTGFDSDGDGIPDDVELDLLVNTDPYRADSDRDGVTDTFEVFGRSFLFLATDGEAGSLYEEDTLFDANENGLQAAIDPAETGEEFMVDSDGDGVYNYLEYYGYTYDWPLGRFVVWTKLDRETQPDVPWFRTDPLQPSTDQDAYPDGMEASGLLMDVAVCDPGRHPLVPAQPNIVIRLAGYQVTLNEDVTYEDGGSVAKGYSWSRETQLSSSQSDNVGVEVGGEIGYDKGFTAKGHLNVSYGHQWSHTTTVSNAVGTTVNKEISWNRARSQNPTQAAQLKLMLKIENHGTCPVSNLVPTLNLSIGGANAATFKPSSLEVNMLMPEAVYPEGETIYWVIDSTEDGPLMLTDWELRALENGAPIQIFVTQIDADVMRLNEEGEWVSAGDVNEYMARCEAVGATVFVDFLDGDFSYARVYAGEGPTAPVVTLRDALRWTMNLTEEDGDRYLEKRMEDDTIKQISITNDAGAGYSMHVDNRNFEELAELDDWLDLRLSPGDHVELSPPRDPQEIAPRIYSAYAMPLDGGYLVTACATDFDGIAKVECLDTQGTRHRMYPDGRGPWFFSCNVPEERFAGNGTERIEVTSVNSTVAVASIEVEIIHTVVSLPPYIGSMVYDETDNILQVTIKPGTDLPEDVIEEYQWPRIYHPLFPGDFITMSRTNFWFEKPYVYQALIPLDTADWQDDDDDPLRVVAKSKGGDYTAVDVDELEVVTPHAWGTVTIDCAYTPPFFGEPAHMVVSLVDLDYKALEFHPAYYRDFETEESISSDGAEGMWHDGGWPADELAPFSQPNPNYPYHYNDYDFYLRSNQDFWHLSVHRLGFKGTTGGRKLDPTGSGKSALVFYQELTKKDLLKDWQSTFQPGTDDQSHPHPGSVYGFRTTEGKYGKLYIKTTELKIFRALGYPIGTWFHMEAQFVIFR